MAQPSNLKVKRLLELDQLPPNTVGEAWMYAVRPGNPNKDHKVFLPDLIEESVEIVSDEIIQDAGEYTDQEVDQVRQDLLNASDSLGTDMVTYKLDDTNSVARGLRDKLGDIVSVKDFGVTTSGNQSENIQRALDFLADRGGGILDFPEGEFRARNLVARDNVVMRGVFGKTILKVPDGVDSQIIYNPGRSTGTPIRFFGMEGIIFDGNADVAPRTTAASAAGISVVEFCYVKNCVFRNSSGYGFGFQGQPSTYEGPQSDLYMENCYFLDNGIGALSGGDTFDGIDVKGCDRLTMVGCVAARNADKGINIRGRSVSLLGCHSYDNAATGVELGASGGSELQPSWQTISGCTAIGNGAHGFVLTPGRTSPVQELQATMSSCIAKGNASNGLYIIPDKVYAAVTGGVFDDNGSNGIRVAEGAGDTLNRAVTIGTVIARRNGASGILTEYSAAITGAVVLGNTLYGIEMANSPRTMISGGYASGNALGAVGADGTNWRMDTTFRTNPSNNAYDLASAATIVIPPDAQYVSVTGTATITDIPLTYRGHIVTLRFISTASITDGGTLSLAGNFTGAANATITLVCTSDRWSEISRSFN